VCWPKIESQVRFPLCMHHTEFPCLAHDAHSHNARPQQHHTYTHASYAHAAIPLANLPALPRPQLVIPSRDPTGLWRRIQDRVRCACNSFPRQRNVAHRQTASLCSDRHKAQILVCSLVALSRCVCGVCNNRATHREIPW